MPGTIAFIITLTLWLTLHRLSSSQQLLTLELRDQSRQLSTLGLAMKTPGYVGQPHSCDTSSSLTALSCLPIDPSDILFTPSSQWGQQSDSELPSSTQQGKPDFLYQRSVSMVETSSLGWPGADLKNSQSDLSPPALNTSVSASSSRYKTELCRSFTESGVCKYGGKCQFAHGQDELRDLSRHPKYKTTPCRTFHTIGFCPYGMRCHFVHNSEEEKHLSCSSSPSSFSSSSSFAPPTTRSRPPLVRQSFSFAGFPSAAPPGLPSSANTTFTRVPSASPPCGDVTDLLSHAFLEMDSAFEASPAHVYQPTSAADQRSPFLPSPDSGCSPCGPSPTASPSLRQSPSACGVFPGPLGTRSLSYTSLSDHDQDGSSSASSLSGSESCSGVHEGSGKRLAVFSQLSVPEDTARVCVEAAVF